MNRFRFIAVFAILLMLTSCEEEDVDLKRQVEWEKIEFVDGGAIYAIHGDLKDYLLVATTSQILRSEDGGKTWNTAANVVSPVGDFWPLNDDIYAITNDTDYVSHDQGLTWVAEEFNHDLFPRSQNFNDSKWILYQVVDHVDSELRLPTSLLRSLDKGNSWESIFPFKRIFYSWHIDAHDRVYIGTWEAIWDGRFFVSDDAKNKAYLYYMK